jgi:O-antigen/teichoic acid export membrane protein
MMRILSRLRHRLDSGDSSFLKNSAILTFGFTIARLLGLGFTLLLGRVLPAEDYGYIQHTILVSGLLLIGIQPFMQHILARELSANCAEPERLTRVFSSALVLAPIMALVTLLAAVPLFVFGGGFNVGVIVIFVGVAVFYSYLGTARGFEASIHLVAVFIASNLIQLLLILLAYFVFHARSPQPALVIYGLSYLLPVLFASWRYPLPVYFQSTAVDSETVRNLVKVSVPVWVSHATFAFSAGADIFLLQRAFPNSPEIGAYAFTRQLSLMFDFVPMALQTLILPRMIRSGSASRRRLLLTSMALVGTANCVCAAIYLLGYEWFIRTFFNPGYLLPAMAVLLLVFAQSMYGVYGVVTSALVGVNRGAVEMLSRILTLITIYVTCGLLIPTMGTTGAALAQCITAIIGVATLPLLLAWRKALERRAGVVRERSIS